MATSPIGAGAIVPAGSTIFFVSGIPGDGKIAGTQAQTMDCLTKLGSVLKAQGFDYKDVVNAKGVPRGRSATGKMDFMA